MAEHPALNRQVGGSNPPGITKKPGKNSKCFIPGFGSLILQLEAAQLFYQVGNTLPSESKSKEILLIVVPLFKNTQGI